MRIWSIWSISNNIFLVTVLLTSGKRRKKMINKNNSPCYRQINARIVNSILPIFYLHSPTACSTTLDTPVITSEPQGQKYVKIFWKKWDGFAVKNSSKRLFFFPVEMLTSGYSQERQINGNEWETVNYINWDIACRLRRDKGGIWIPTMLNKLCVLVNKQYNHFF